MGGAAGHMSHPFDLPRVKTGDDLISFFDNTNEYVSQEPEKSSLKIDGVNVSFKLVDGPNGKEFAIDRGSTKPIDIDGVTYEKLEDRFKSEVDPETGLTKTHGMVPAGQTLLTILNSSLEDITPELKKLGLYDDPTKFLNTEFVLGKTNVTDYNKNFLALHGVNQFYEKRNKITGNYRPGKERPANVKAPSVEVSYNKEILNSLAGKLKDSARRSNFEVYTSVPVSSRKKINYDKTLGSPFSIQMTPELEETFSLRTWLAGVNNPRGERIRIHYPDGKTKMIGALSKEVYLNALNNTPFTDLFPNKEDLKKAISGAVLYHATRYLGNDILQALTSDMGDVSAHEGIVIRDLPGYQNVPVKITGEFILGGLKSSFKESLLRESYDDIETVVAIYPGRFQPMGRHHAQVFKRIAEEYGVENSYIATSNVVQQPKSPFDFSEKQMIAVSHGIPVENVIMTNNPYKATEILDKYDPATTAVMYFVGSKDMDENPRFANLGGMRRDGSPRYFKKYEKGDSMEGYNKHGYIAVAPHVSINITDQEEMSGTTLRNALKNANEDEFERIMGFYNSDIFQLVKTKLNSLKEETQYPLGIFRGVMEEVFNELQDGSMYGVVGSSLEPTPSSMRKKVVSDEEEEEEDLEEISAAGGGAVQGAVTKKKKKKQETDNLVNEFYNYLLCKMRG